MRAQSTAWRTAMRRFSDKTPDFIGSTHHLYTNTHACEATYSAFSLCIVSFFGGRRQGEKCGKAEFSLSLIVSDLKFNHVSCKLQG